MKDELEKLREENERLKRDNEFLRQLVINLSAQPITVPQLAPVPTYPTTPAPYPTTPAPYPTWPTWQPWCTNDNITGAAVPAPISWMEITPAEGYVFAETAEVTTTTGVAPFTIAVGVGG